MIEKSHFQDVLSESNDICRPHLYRAVGITGACPSCGSELGKKPRASVLEGGTGFCNACKWQGNGRKQTILQSSKLSDSQLFFLFAFVKAGADQVAASELLGIAPVTYERWRNRLAEQHGLPERDACNGPAESMT